jgi:hypothetical protein
MGPKLGPKPDRAIAITRHQPRVGRDAEVEERATALFKTLVALASAQRLSSIDEGEKAMQILGSLLSGKTESPGASAS